MPRKQHLTAYLRSTKAGRFWYASWYENGRRVIRATDIRANPKQKDRGRSEAIEITRAAIQERASSRPGDAIPFATYAAPYFVWDTCPHVRRLLDEGKEITRRWCHQQRGWLTRRVLGDDEHSSASFALKPLGEITRADLIDFRSHLRASLGDKPNTVNKVMGVVKTIFKEAIYREEISRDPSSGLGTVKEHRRAPGTFTQEEISSLFPAEGLGPWRDLTTFTCFLLAAETGMRRGEILVLRWGNVDFEKARIYVTEAWKGGKEIGTPKWGRKREFALPAFTAVKLAELKRTARHHGNQDFAFADPNGNAFRATWWKQRFTAAMKNANIDTKARFITPHSFRHTLNSLLLLSGAEPLKVRAALGWASARIQENYLHITSDQLRDVSARVDAIFSGSSPDKEAH